MFEIAFNDVPCSAYGLIPESRPAVPAANRDIEEITIPGRDGVLIVDNERRDSITISAVLNFIVPVDLYGEEYRTVQKWLDGSGTLVMSDDQSVFYKVLYCQINDHERRSNRVGRITVNFVCMPSVYLVSGQESYAARDVLYNPYRVSRPTYLITGEGVCTLTVNGNTMTANVGQNLTINTELMQAYRTDGTMQNTAVSGKYKELYLQNGENTISITSGFKLSVIPNWEW